MKKNKKAFRKLRQVYFLYGPMSFIHFAVFNTIDTARNSRVHVPFGFCITSIAKDVIVPTLILFKMRNDYSLLYLLRWLFSAVVACGKKRYNFYFEWDESRFRDDDDVTIGVYSKCGEWFCPFIIVLFDVSKWEWRGCAKAKPIIRTKCHIERAPYTLILAFNKWPPTASNFRMQCTPVRAHKIHFFLAIFHAIYCNRFIEEINHFRNAIGLIAHLFTIHTYDIRAV